MRAYKIKSDWRKTRGSDKIITTYSMNIDYVNMPNNTLFKDNWDNITYLSLGVFSIQFRVLVKEEIDDEIVKRKVKHYITNNISRKNIVIVEEANNKGNCKCYRISLTMKTSLPTKTDIEKLIDDVTNIIFSL